MATMVSFHSFFFISLAISIIFVSRFSITKANNGGFTVDLIHRDLPKSPFHNPSLTPSQRLNNALQRSFPRVHRLMSFSPLSASANVTPNGGEYIMKISWGPHRFKFLQLSILVVTLYGHNATTRSLISSAQTVLLHIKCDLATETVKLGSTTLRDIIFGYGHDNGGTFSNAGAGIVGLGGGQVSLIS
ncbi:unnamed protein product [Ilex paraguariensis]|uniref:Uncharacterized protein n=1 Tax=Ilex paraguariensis TaxID=185542 RepID=A0ABC8RVK9_9AQUA